MASSLLKPHSHCSALPSGRSSGLHGGSCPATVHVVQRPARRRGQALKARAFPLDVVPLMVTMVEHVDNQRDWVVTKSIWHLSDTAIKSFCETSTNSSSRHSLVPVLLARLQLQLRLKLTPFLFIFLFG